MFRITALSCVVAMAASGILVAAESEKTESAESKPGTTSSPGDKPQPSAPAKEVPAESDKKDEAVRKLAVEVDRARDARWRGKPGVRVANDEKELTELFGEAVAKQITGKLDFTKEKVVHVGWGSSGPPFGRLRHEIKGEKDDKTITFFVWAPRTFVAGQAFRLGNDFFAVPKGWKVTFGGTR